MVLLTCEFSGSTFSPLLSALVSSKITHALRRGCADDGGLKVGRGSPFLDLASQEAGS